MANPSIRVLSYNVHGQDDDRAALASVVRTLSPDLVFVQEGPRRFRWRTRAADLAHRFGLIYAAGGLPSLGNLILTSQRIRVHDTWCLRYPLTPGRHMRGAAFARCSIGGVSFVAGGSHLATDDAERLSQARMFKAALDAVSEPVIVGCDFNEMSLGSSFATLAEGLVDAGAETDVSTFPVWRADRRIDAIMVDPRLRIERFEVVDSDLVRRASDHFPIVADVEVTAGKHEPVTT